MSNQQVVAMVAEGITVVSDAGVVVIEEWSAITKEHYLIEDGQSYQIGVQVGLHIARMMAANDG